MFTGRRLDVFDARDLDDRAELKVVGIHVGVGADEVGVVGGAAVDGLGDGGERLALADDVGAGLSGGAAAVAGGGQGTPGVVCDGAEGRIGGVDAAAPGVVGVVIELGFRVGGLGGGASIGGDHGPGIALLHALGRFF